jgi:deoxyribonuclease IV
VGSHVDVAGGLASQGLAYAADVGAEAIQVFVSNPRGWSPSAGDQAEDVALARHAAHAGLPVFVHAPYLVNLGSADQQTAALSAEAVRHTLDRSARIGARGVVVHAGSASGWDRPSALRQIADLLLPLLDKLGDDDPGLLIEPMAGQGQVLCAQLGELEPYLEALEWHPRAGVCLDTCHAFAAGHDLTAPGGVGDMLATLDRAVRGTGRVQLVHANDSAQPCGSRRDKHAAIGAGLIGLEPFRELLHHPMLAAVPFVVETPKAGHAGDVAVLKELRDSAARQQPRDVAAHLEGLGPSA